MKLICFSKKSDDSIQNLENEYIKRLKGFYKIDMKILKPFSITSCNSEIEVMQKEAVVLEKYIKDSYLIVLERTGEEMSSIEFSNKLTYLKNSGQKNIIFVIGGAYGVYKSIIDKANLKISLSKMTFTHEISRIILLEQVYRAWTISQGKRYHY